jgi:prolyl-tRNA synthetase
LKEKGLAMSTQESEALTSAGEAQALPDRTGHSATDTAAPETEVSKNAAKKAAKQAKMAADKASKKGIGKQEAKKPTSKAPKKKIEGAALIGIDVAKDEDFPGWYQQVLTKGDMLDYYDVSGCFILKVSFSIRVIIFAAGLTIF